MPREVYDPVSESPYAPPKAAVGDVGPGGLSLSTPLAGSGARIANLLLDYLFAWLFTVVCAFVVEWRWPGGAIRPGTGTPWSRRFFGMFIYTVYYLVLEATFGWTLAKLITRTRVVDKEGRKPAFMTVLGRSLARSVPLEPFSFLGKTGVGWHDRWSGTRVVSMRRTSGPTLADSFDPDFRKSPTENAKEEAAAAAGPAWTPSDGPPAWCPNCKGQITATTPKCAACGADFTSPEGWKPLAERP